MTRFAPGKNGSAFLTLVTLQDHERDSKLSGEGKDTVEALEKAVLQQTQLTQKPGT